MNQTPDQIIDTESVEKVPKKCLMIDDHSSIIISINNFFRDYENFKAVQCTTVDNAVAVISEELPDILFLDHNLTSTLSGPAGEGLEIARQVQKLFPHIEIYSTSTDESAIHKYIKAGINIKSVGKGDLLKMKELIAGD